MIQKHSRSGDVGSRLTWHDGDLRWLGALLCAVSAALVILALVVVLG